MNKAELLKENRHLKRQNKELIKLISDTRKFLEKRRKWAYDDEGLV